MTRKNDLPIDQGEKRQKAENRLSKKTAEMQLPRTVGEMRRLVHELEVHQIELEMQQEELHQASDTVETLLKKYTDLYNFAPVGYFILGRDGLIISVNFSAAALLGIETSLLIGRRFGMYVVNEARPLFAEFFDKVFANQVNESCEMALMTERPVPLYVQIEAVAFVSGQECLIAVIDITERRRLESELKIANMQNELILESVGEGIIGLDLQGKHTFVNSSAAAMLGYEINELVGKESHSTWHNVLPDGSRYPMEKCPVYAACKIGTIQSGEDRFLRKDGTGFPVQFTSRPIIYDKKIVGAVLTFSDITERKRMEKMVESLNTDLTGRAAELEAFNYSVAHDLRQPLNVISSYCQALKELCGIMLDAQCQRYLQEVYNGSLRMSRLIEALLNFSRFGQVEPRREWVDLSPVAHEVAIMLKQNDPERQVDFRIASGIMAYGDSELLRVVLDNLLGNAWKFTGMKEKAVIEFGVEDHDGKPVYFVKDNGAGFNNADSAKLFIPFQRLPGAEEYRGFGIGLATVERIIRRHGGRLCPDGEPGKGASFYFTLQT